MARAGRWASAITGVGAALALAGCFSPKIDDGDFQCAVTEPRCPPDFTCGSDNRCRKGGGITVDGEVPDGVVQFNCTLMVTAVADLTDVVFGTTVSTPPSVFIRNTGTANCGAIVLTPMGLDASAFRIVNDMCSNRMLGPNDSCRFDVGNNPDATVGQKTATIRVDGQSGMPHDVSLKMNVKSILTVDPPDHMFPTTAVNTSSTAKQFQFMNTGTIRADMLRVQILGVDAADFQLSNDFCTGSNLQPGTPCNVSVVFKPLSAGSKNARLELTSKPGGPASATLRGN